MPGSAQAGQVNVLPIYQVGFSIPNKHSALIGLIREVVRFPTILPGPQDVTAAQLLHWMLLKSLHVLAHEQRVPRCRMIEVFSHLSLSLEIFNVYFGQMPSKYGVCSVKCLQTNACDHAVLVFHSSKASGLISNSCWASFHNN